MELLNLFDDFALNKEQFGSYKLLRTDGGF